MATDPKTITVSFIPQAWVNDYAVNVDIDLPNTWEVPVEMVRGIEPDDYASDELRDLDNAPEWVREWSGPFYVTWDEAEAAEKLNA